ncbi:O-acyltransferase like protein-like [Topomyia yanbarensis]|uniref:O-acyltransferase like protein-like n=1 Tax=Topomyia yanbarensis TaxID=2498891 RepID=UPI00273B46B5|nr:O-acyltransferase like protein-like [Topomyia yanbarensis]
MCSSETCRGMKRFSSADTVVFWWYICCCWLLPAVYGTNFASSLMKMQWKLPKLFKYDDFDECRKGNPRFQYCIVQAVIRPNESSDIWHNISLLSANPLNFPHDHLERGICLHDCLRRVFPVEQLEIDQMEILASNDELRLDYLSRCVNMELEASHQLQTSASILHCLSEENFLSSFGLADQCFLGMVIALVLLVGVATVRDCKGSDSKYDQLIQPFSLPHNINKLLNTAKSDGSLPHLEGLRALFMLVIILVHSSLPFIRMPLNNPEDMESQTNHLTFPIWNSGNTHMITFFFALGGMVLAVSFLSQIERSPTVDFRFLLKKLLNRLARLVPAYAFVIFYQATLFKRTKQRPHAARFNDYCSEYWWTNLLFINNYVHLDEPCMKFGWYLGADFQLFLIGMAIMTLIWKFPKTKKACIGVVVFVSFWVPGYVIYVEKLDATMMFSMRHALTELREYDFFEKFYTPGHINAGSYFFGMIAGNLYHHISQNKLHSSAELYLSKVLYVFLTVLFFLNGFLVMLPSIPQKKPSLFLSIYGSALKAIFGIGHGILFLYFGFKTNSMSVAFLQHPILRVMGRLSYSIYIVQYAVIYTIYSNMSIPTTYSGFNLIFVTSAVLFMSFLSGAILHLVVEVPCATVLKKAIDGKLDIGSRKISKKLL